MKKTVSLMLSLCLIFSLCTFFGISGNAEESVAHFSHSGDANGDGIINSKDVLLLRKSLAGMIVVCFTGADVNADFVQNSKDVLLLRKHMAGMNVGAQMKDLTLTEDTLNFPLNWRRGINIGNALEGVTEGASGVVIKDEYFTMIRNQGFDYVRIPIRWSTHLDEKGTILPEFFERVDHVINSALSENLGVIINIHHFTDLMSDVDKYEPLLYSIWDQLAEHYKNLPYSVMFEPLNEPETVLGVDRWNSLQNNCIKHIRKTNPTRKLLVTGIWGSYDQLDKLVLPRDDENLVGTFHYYSPFEFTHQGASWASDMDKYLGTTWSGTKSQISVVENNFMHIKAWSKAMNIPVLMGEFGAYEKADMDSRATWTQCVRTMAEKYGFSWCYWEFCAGFGIYDRSTASFKQPLLKALVPDAPYDEIGVGVGSPEGIAAADADTIGPVTYKYAVDCNVPSWCAYSVTNNSDSITIDVNNPKEWSRIYFPLDITDNGSGFSGNTVTIKLKNIDKSVTHIIFNLENSDASVEKSLKELYLDNLNEAEDANGIITLSFNISSLYSSYKGKFADGISLKAFIESDPRAASTYDGVGQLEVYGISVK